MTRATIPLITDHSSCYSLSSCNSSSFNIISWFAAKSCYGVSALVSSVLSGSTGAPGGGGGGLPWRCAICAMSPLLGSCERQGPPRRCNWHLLHSLLHSLSFCETHGQATVTKLITTFTPRHGFFEPSQDTPRTLSPASPGHVMVWGFLRRNTLQRPFLGRPSCLCHVPEAETWLSLCFMCSNYSPQGPQQTSGNRHNY